MTTEQTFQTGVQLLQEKKYTEAYDKFNVVVADNPRFVEAYIGLGLCLEKTGKLLDASRMYQKAVQNDPQNITAIYNLGVVYLGLNQNFKAWWQFKKTLAIDPKNSQALHNLGLIHFNGKRYRLAISCLLRAAESPNEKAYAIHFLLAKAYKACGREAETFFHLFKSLQFQGTFLPTLFELLKLYQQKNEWSNFFEVVKRIYQLCPDNQVLQGEILNSLKAIKEKNPPLNSAEGRKLDRLISEFKEEQEKEDAKPTPPRPRVRDLNPRVIIPEPDDDAPRIYH